MKRVLRLLRIGLLSAGLLLVLAGAIVYVLSERILHRSYAEPRVGIAVPSDPASISEGHRLAMIRGCANGCHGAGIEGGVFVDNLLLARLIAPSLTAAVRRYDNADLVRIIRRQRHQWPDCGDREGGGSSHPDQRRDPDSSRGLPRPAPRPRRCLRRTR